MGEVPISQGGREGGTASGNESRRKRKLGRKRERAKVLEGEGWLKGTPPGNPAPTAHFQGIKVPKHLDTHTQLHGYISPAVLASLFSPAWEGGGRHTGEGQGEKTRC